MDIAGQLLRRFSSRFIKDYVFDLVLELLYDPVPNVRLAATGLLPPLKSVVQLPGDVDLLERLNTAMSNIMTDNDRDVSQVGLCGVAVLLTSLMKSSVKEAPGAGSVVVVVRWRGCRHAL